MTTASPFGGFPPETLDFLRNLEQNNERAWFERHRADYERHLLDPSRAFVETMGRLLLPAAPHLHAEPKVNRSLFRIYRDTRFSADKTPFKTHLGLWMWEGRGKRMECSGFYFQLEPDRMLLAVGIYGFERRFLKSYRKAVTDPSRGEALAQAVDDVRAAGYAVGGETYKRLPVGYPSDHPRPVLMRHSGLYVFRESKPIKALHRPTFAEWCLKHYLAMLPVHAWLRSVAS